MNGIQYVTDQNGRKVAVQIDLREHAALWEDIEDVLISRSREGEPGIPLGEVELKLKRRGKIPA
jgi:hypothetical protein